jgi:hypothetical protein
MDTLLLLLLLLLLLNTLTLCAWQPAQCLHDVIFTGLDTSELGGLRSGSI